MVCFEFLIPKVITKIYLSRTLKAFIWYLIVIIGLMKGRGALIVFEGCDCSGKSSQAKKILEKMFENGFKAEIINFPGKSFSFALGHSDYSFYLFQ